VEKVGRVFLSLSLPSDLKEWLVCRARISDRSVNREAVRILALAQASDSKRRFTDVPANEKAPKALARSGAQIEIPNEEISVDNSTTFHTVARGRTP